MFPFESQYRSVKTSSVMLEHLWVVSSASLSLLKERLLNESFHSTDISVLKFCMNLKNGVLICVVIKSSLYVRDSQVDSAYVTQPSANVTFGIRFSRLTPAGQAASQYVLNSEHVHGAVCFAGKR